MHANSDDAALADDTGRREPGRPGDGRSAAKLRWLVVGLGLVTNLAILSLLLVDLLGARERALADAGRATETLAVALEEHAIQTFTRLDLGLRALDEDPTIPGITFPANLVKAQAQLSQIQRVSPTLKRLDL